ncbi:MAG: serine/threonine protein kinase [Phycisphaerales bacterium]|nr:MAG: serine/threonine protein kinase [Phycisphaerales bacterium]
MTPERHALIREVFLAAVSCPPEDRDALLDQRCGDDHELRREVEHLISHHYDQTITPDSQKATTPTDAWRQAGPQLNLDARETAALPPRTSSQPDVPRDKDLSSGSVVAGRYRIVSQLGSGGMGVVYRAEDLTLGQTVALKFLNPGMAKNPEWLARFRTEVRRAREVTHPCVCRMYDIAEADGKHFLTMEYVDGEDLDSLTTRIGRLPHNKAVDIARQVCIGLAAAHDAGILHRDLKPANIMLDGRGQVRITDFGLAALPEEVKAGEIRAGTPAYMAPEQIAGREVTVQSDIYALGLVLYEVFAGRPTFQASTIQEYHALHESSRPTPLSDVIEDVHPDVERIVARCLEKNAQSRPSSALEVAAALPGGNLLAAALAANLTPTPEMVAAATPQAGRTLAPARLLVVTLAMLAALVLVRGLSPTSWLAQASKPPAVLAAQARELIKAAGYSFGTGEHAYGFCKVQDAAALAHGYRMPDRMARLAVDPAAELVFWYRQSQEMLAPSEVRNVMLGAARVTPSDPVPGTSDMVSVVFDPSGKLLLFVAIPGHESSSEEQGSGPGRDHWDVLLRHALLDPADMIAEDPGVESIYQTERRFAWKAPELDGGEGAVHVEAMASNGRPLFFAIGQSTEDGAVVRHPERMGARETVVTGSLRIVFLLITVVSIPLAWLNYRAGRSDRTGAMRLAIFVVVVQFVTWLLRAKHVAGFNAELQNICLAGLQAIGVAGLLGVFYIALEPLARRYWPDMLITWSRALSLRWRDPTVGQHVIVGVCVGCFWVLIGASERALVSSLGWEARASLLADTVANNLLGGRLALAGFLSALPFAMFRGLLFLLLLAVLRALVRRPLLAAVIAGAIIASMMMPRGAHVYTSWLAIGIGGVAVGVWVMIRYGLLTLTVALYVTFVLNTSPITFDFQAWYADQSLYVLTIVTALATYGFITARSGTTAG